MYKNKKREEKKVRQYRQLLEIVKGVVKFNESMKNHTSFHIGGPADVLIVPCDVDDIKRIVKFACKNNIALYVIGNGTKLLVKDKGLRGIVLNFCSALDNIEFQDEEVTVGAGFPLPKLSKLAAQRELSGLEFAIGIPGTVGGAVVMNAGAYGGTMGDIVTQVTVMDLKSRIYTLSRDELEYGLRESRLQKTKEIVLNARLKLKKDKITDIGSRMVKFQKHRKRTQSLTVPNAGCIFKAGERISVGKLIDLSGAKDMRVGDAEVSTLHANFIVNRGNASAQDVLVLMEKIHKMVHRKFNIKLTPEIKVIGEG